jgi:hypothetical protein
MNVPPVSSTYANAASSDSSIAEPALSSISAP